MELFLDIDGVILDFESAFTDFIRDQYIPDLPTDFGPQTWDMVNEFEGVDIDEAWDIFVNSETDISSLSNIISRSVINLVSGVTMIS